MLFQNKINQLNATVSNINNTIEDLSRQIEQLREQKLALETHLQELGSAENAAESALVQVQTAINMIEAISPDQLVEFKAAIDSLFNANIPALPSAEPEAPTPTEETIIVEPSLEEYVDGDNTIADLLKDEYQKTTTNGEGAWIKRLSMPTLRKLCKERGLATTGTKADLQQRLKNHGLLQADVVIANLNQE
jgi:ABC-type transporter Mla subunit MlaD